jgi:hypothetical protein
MTKTLTRAAWASDDLWARIQRGRRLIAAEWAQAREMHMRASMRREQIDRQFVRVWTGTLERQGRCDRISSYEGHSQLDPQAVERYRIDGGEALSPAHKLQKRQGAE